MLLLKPISILRTSNTFLLIPSLLSFPVMLGNLYLWKLCTIFAHSRSRTNSIFTFKEFINHIIHCFAMGTVNWGFLSAVNDIFLLHEEHETYLSMSLTDANSLTEQNTVFALRWTSPLLSFICWCVSSAVVFKVDTRYNSLWYCFSTMRVSW